MRQPRTILWRLAGVLLTVAIVFGATAQRTQAQDLTTLLANFLRTLYAGTLSVGGNGDVLLVRDAANVLAMKNAANAQEMRVYGTTTGPKYLKLSHDGTYPVIGSEGTGAIAFVGTFLFGTDDTYDIGAVAANRPKNIHVAGYVNAAGLKINGVDVATSTDTYWNAEAPGISYASPVGLNTTPVAGSPLAAAVTWNAGATTFTGLKLNVTDTASAAASLLLDLQVGGTSQFKVSKTGTVTAGTISGYRFAATYGTATDSSPVFNGSQTWNDAADVFTGLLVNVTDTASAAASLLMDLQVGGASKFSVSKGGIVTTASSVAVPATASYGFLSRGYIQAEATGVFTLLNAATTDFNRLQFGGTTSSFPALTRSSATLQVTLADGSAYAGLRASYFAFTNGSSVLDSADGIIRLSNAAGNDFTRLQFGGTTNAFPAISRSGTALNVILADTSGYAGLNAAAFIAQGAAAYVGIGTNPASAGAVRLANNTAVNWRNAANDADIGGWSVNASNALVIGNAVTPASSGTRFLCISTAGVITSSASACSGT